jgi:hypothetical protein
MQHPIGYQCCHGTLVQLRCVGQTNVINDHDVSKGYVIISECSCNGRHPTIGPGWTITGQPRNESHASQPALLLAAE